jgi:hypothetical protein
MIEKFFEQLNLLKSHIALSSEAKADIRDRLVMRMNAHAALARPAVARRFSPLVMRFAAVLGAFAVLGAGTSYASEQTAPGDALYPVKILNEEVRAAVAFGAEAQAEWESQRAQRRLDEAAKLAASGKLDAEIQADLESRFAAHAERVQARLAMLQTKEQFQAAAGLAAQFEASLEAHNRILATLEGRDSGRGRSVAAIKRQVATRLQSVQDARANSEDKVDLKKDDSLEVAAAAKIAQASTSILAAGGSFGVTAIAPPEAATTSVGNENAATMLAPQDQARIAPLPQVKMMKKKRGSELDQAQQLYLEARAKLEVKDFKAAFNLANQAVKAAGEAKVLKKAEKELKIRVQQSDDDDDTSSAATPTTSIPQAPDDDDDRTSGQGGFDLKSFLRLRN